jgi:hypothetical protein
MLTPRLHALWLDGEKLLAIAAPVFPKSPTDLAHAVAVYLQFFKDLYR